jgi:hypothetical protein
MGENRDLNRINLFELLACDAYFNFEEQRRVIISQE